MGRLDRIPPLHPILIGIYPVLALLANNAGQVPLSDGWRALVASLVVASLVVPLIMLLVRDWHWAALYASLVILLFFSYGHAYDLLKGIKFLGFEVGRHRYLVLLWLGLLFTFWQGIRMAQARDWNSVSATWTLNLIGAVMIAIPLYAILTFAFRIRNLAKPIISDKAVAVELSISPEAQNPDIYYIILDAYAREDVLLAEFGYDNSPFLDELKRLGFFVAESSQSNYAQTELSLASSLSMEYLHNLSDGFLPESDDRSELWRLIWHSNVRRALEEIGYSTVAYETGFNWTQLPDADYYFTRHVHAENRLSLSGMNSFEELFLQTTAGKVVLDGLVVLSRLTGEEVIGNSSASRERILYVIDTLDDVWMIDRPKFVFVHMVIPHPPFVFGPNGENPGKANVVSLRGPANLSDDEYVEAYRDQVEFINSQMAPIIENIIVNSNPSPVIVLQADHGPDRSGQRMAILNAIYLPVGPPSGMTSTTSPVNTFRFIFNSQFGAKFDILDDVSYFSNYDAPYDFKIVPNPDAP